MRGELGLGAGEVVVLLDGEIGLPALRGWSCVMRRADVEEIA
jgi:hypothetical protein